LRRAVSRGHSLCSRACVSSCKSSRYYSSGHHHEEEEVQWPEQFQPNASVEVLFGPSRDVDSEYWANEDNWDPHDYEWKCKVELLLYEWLQLPREQHEQFRKDHDISKGYMSLEWVLPSPMPEHTFDELPIVKEVD